MLLPTATVLIACIQRPQSGAKLLNWKMWRRPFCELVQPSSRRPSGVTDRLGEADPGRVGGRVHSSTRLGADASTAAAAGTFSPWPPQPARASAEATRMAESARLGIGAPRVERAPARRASRHRFAP